MGGYIRVLYMCGTVNVMSTLTLLELKQVARNHNARKCIKLTQPKNDLLRELQRKKVNMRSKSAFEMPVKKNKIKTKSKMKVKKKVGAKRTVPLPPGPKPKKKKRVQPTLVSAPKKAKRIKPTLVSAGTGAGKKTAKITKGQQTFKRAVDRITEKYGDLDEDANENLAFDVNENVA